ncbi:hypothetical protein AYI69_g3375 [Smittium culicis]|uniref:Uncharacterized protein n=1 Tax=Smittium culicis TaxID=133412 RepID=A0A1R1YJV3_9FUNG|nr:hypothetical protein AYI69_g3375 [Smittium culicis]
MRSQQATDCWSDEIEISGELYRESPINICCSFTWPSNAPKNPGAQEPLSVDIEITDFNNESDKPCHLEPIILEEPAEITKRFFVVARYSGVEDFHELLRFSVGDCGRAAYILRIMDTIRGKDAHQGNDDGFVRTHSQSLVGQAVIVYSDNTTTLSYVKKFGGTNSPERLDRIQKKLCMYDLESDGSSRAEGAQGTNNDEISLYNVEISQMVPGSDVPLGVIEFTTASKNSSTRPQKRKISALGKQELELIGTDNQRRYLENQDLGINNFFCILSNERRFRCHSRYRSIHKSYFNWRISN